MTNRKSKLSLFADQGKVPPQCLEIEEAVLGACLLEEGAFIRVAEHLKPEAFYKEAHQMIYSAIQSLFKKNEPIDILTAINELKSKGEIESAGGAFYLTQLTNNVASSSNIEFHAKIILQKWVARENIRLASELIRDSYEDTTDPFKALETTMLQMNNVFEVKNSRQTYSIDALVGQEREDRQKPEILGIKTGINALDKTILGYNAPDLNIIAARPSMGKSAFVFSSMRNLGANNIPCGLFSLEMSAKQVLQRLISIENDANNEQYRKRTLPTYLEKKVIDSFDRIAKYPIYIDDTPALSIIQLRAKAISLKIKHGIKVIFVDYLQLMSGEGKSREEIVSEISRGLKALAKELNIPVIALSQLNRSVESRSDKRPSLADLRESGAIEQDADMVMFLFRPDYYNKDYDSNGKKRPMVDKDGNTIPEDFAEGLIEKNRNGKTGAIPLKFAGYSMKYSDWDEESEIKEDNTIPF